MKNHISTFSNLMLKYPVFAFLMGFVFLFFGCKSKEEVKPNQPPLPFNVTAKLLANEQDVILTWTKSIDPDGDNVTYSVVYTDTLAKNLSDTTFIIKNLAFETEIQGNVIAKDTKGSKTISNFSIKTGTTYIIIPDVNFEKALIQLKIDDVQDGKVLRTNVFKVTSLNISSFPFPGDRNINYDKIKDLTGIGEFVNLKTLDCSYNGLTNLDVSKNIALNSLDCSSNELTNLDVSKSITLTYLGCSVNQLSNLDVSKNIALKRLYCSINQLSNLDVSKNIALAHLTCEGNQLIKLDVSKNIALDILYCYRNQLTNLDVSKNIALTYLYCYDNQLPNLDVSKNIALNILYCFNNQLTNLDVSKNIALTYFSCIYNKIQTICVKNLSQVKPDWQKDPTAIYKVCP